MSFSDDDWEAMLEDDFKQPDNEKELSDPLLEKKRIQQQIERSEADLVADLFDVEIKKPTVKPKATRKTKLAGMNDDTDPFDQIDMKTYNDLESAATRLAEKLAASQAKTTGFLRFMDILLKECSAKMELRELQTFDSKVNVLLKEKQLAADRKKQDASMKRVNQTRGGLQSHIDEQLDDYFDEDEEEEYVDEYDAYY
ncbi:MAG: hypothetical protein KVP17_005084 [Porospora cf. gigantea B]|uniref:uncharacterized protein n=1 Tax=Porospora cf. gigantea B TaxID=2853592 RepID=UPI003571BD82|nr:MAG: hypothetical protein KVP17_005084 [Porospora cf. gigantea B]